MPRYAYRAVDRFGVKNRGTAEAANENELFQHLRLQGLSLVGCRVNSSPPFFQGRLPLADQAVLCRHVLAMLEAGVPLQTALEDILASTPDARIHAALSNVFRQVAAGTSLSAAFAATPRMFDPLFPLLLKAGEKTGRLAQAFSHVQENLDWKDSFHKSMGKAFAYPLLQLVLAVGAVAVLTLVAVPQIAGLLSAVGNGMPWYASALLIGMKALGFLFAALLSGILLAAIFLPLLGRASRKAAISIDRMMFRLPLVGPVLLKSALTQTMHILASMLVSGVQMMDALATLPQFVPNRALAAEIESVRREVEAGQSLTAAFRKGMQVPPYVVRLLKVGEDGGDILQSVRHIAVLYQKESQHAADALLKGTSLSITAGVGLVLVAMVLGVIYPLYQGLSVMVAH